MNVTKFNSDMSVLDINQLQEKRDQLKRELFSLKLSAQTSHVKNHAQFNSLRKNIARVMTVMSLKKREQQ